MLRLALAGFLGFWVMGCASTPLPAQAPITVEGEVVARGQEPFSALVLETAERNFYVLVFAKAADRQAVAVQAPLRLRITGEPFLDHWQGRPYAHLRVQHWERLR
ncbi:hypothetical protein [Rhodothermus bifroesti]|uniref:Uncharacterized protein n=1 Tax=Rhodothermus marinus TaxID=29549 RepID=A0A7V2B2I8_RHOMR|nr:hypothetical protein [Rhodothermus bifroesti]GBD01030.1 hypothetical protein HRbin18_00748 [bacterium HR18]